MDFVYENSIPAISMIQQRFNAQKSLMFLLSNVFDPRYAFLIYSPLFFSLDRYTGRKLIWVTVVAEWSNQILKWLLRGERPYWWVLEFGSTNSPSINSTLPPIKQTPMTCETGPGSPSGHAMITAAVFYILVEALLRKIKSGQFSSKRNLLNSVCWSIYTLILVGVSLSRIFLAAHFPHQCVLGMIIGVAVAMMISNLDTDSVSRRGYIFGTIGMFASAMLTYFVLLAFGFNPLWSVERALKWCAKRENVHLDTTPFFSMMRYLGFFLGAGLGMHSATYRSSTQYRFDNKMKFASVFLSLAVSKAMEKIPTPTNVNVNLVYLMVFALNVMLPYIFVGLVPYVVAKLFGIKQVSNSKRHSNSNSTHKSNGSIENNKTKPSKLTNLNDTNNNNIRIRSH